MRPAASPPGVKPYVDPDRINALQALQDGSWDFTRLVELCREIDVGTRPPLPYVDGDAAANDPQPCASGSGVRYLRGGGEQLRGTEDRKTLQGRMQRLETSLRNVADMHLHTPIRPSEDVPTAVQVEFAAELDVLLGEVIRVARGK